MRVKCVPLTCHVHHRHCELANVAGLNLISLSRLGIIIIVCKQQMFNNNNRLHYYHYYQSVIDNNSNYQ